MRFANRQQAGRLLAQKLKKMKLQNCVVVGIPRGGIVVAKEIAGQLKCPFTAIVTRKLTAPHNKEYALGAINENRDVVGDEKEFMEAGKEWVELEIEKQYGEIQRRKKMYGLDKGHKKFLGKTVILVDDGIATGHTMKAAILEVRRFKPKRLLVASPIIPDSTYNAFAKEAEVVALSIPSEREELGAISLYYEEFPQVEDEEVIETLSL